MCMRRHQAFALAPVSSRKVDECKALPPAVCGMTRSISFTAASVYFMDITVSYGPPRVAATLFGQVTISPRLCWVNDRGSTAQGATEALNSRNEGLHPDI